MYIKKINDNLSVSCEVFSNYKNWGHLVKAFYNGREVEKNKVFYINRTWERYQFETALLGLVDKLDKTKTIPLKDRIELYKTITSCYYSFN